MIFLLSDISQVEKSKYCMLSFKLICGIQKIEQIIITKQKQTYRCREQTSGYQWGEGGARLEVED